MASEKKAEPQYDHAALKQALTTVQKFDFEIHDDHTLMRVMSRNNGPMALIRMAHMPRTTIELIHVVKSTFMLQLHPICSKFSISKEGVKTYTRDDLRTSYNQAVAMEKFALVFPEAVEASTFFAAVSLEAGADIKPAIGVDEKLVALEWGTSDGKTNRLRTDVVKKTASVFGKF
jgi:hypothetical protein